MKLGLATVPVHVARDMTEPKIRALRIADNKTSELAEWDFDALARELVDLRESDCVSAVGFSSDEITRLIDSLNPETPSAETPESGREFTEEIADTVNLTTCPHCGKSTTLISARVRAFGDHVERQLRTNHGRHQRHWLGVDRAFG
jgi:hypothetical protein